MPVTRASSSAAVTSGATAHLAFCPTAGIVVERATLHAAGHTFFVQVPMWGGIGPSEQERVVSTVRAAVGVAV